MSPSVELRRKGHRAVEKLIAPESVISYAQAGEDLVLDFLTDYRSSGFYVDVGCNHPRRGSNSFRFYRKGWSGIAIDANPDFEDRFRRHRPRDHFVRACVSDGEDEVDFHIFEGDALSSISGAPLFDDPRKYAIKRIERIKTRRLDAILAEQGAPETFDFLSIDVEGHDEAVLRSIDLDRFIPRVIIVELNATDLDPANAGDSWVARYLGDFGYRIMAIHWGNLFLRREAAGESR